MTASAAEHAAGEGSDRRRLLDVAGLTKYFGDGDERQLCLEGFSFGIAAGRLNMLMGPSGCGKTTLINLIAGYESPDSGSITLGGAPVTAPGPDRLVVFQESTLFPWMTVYGNVVFGCKVQGLSQSETNERAEQILSKVGLYEFRNRYPSELSGGMQRRAELARALINDPKLMIMDEPFRGLDAMTKELMQEFYLKLFEETKLTTLFVTHELEEAIFMADSLVLMTHRPGRVKEIIDVDLPRPRHFSMMASKRYFDLYSYAIGLLTKEARRAFDADITLASDTTPDFP